MIAWLSLFVFGGTSVVTVLVFRLLNRDGQRAAARVRQLGGGGPGKPTAEWVSASLARLPLVGAALLKASEAGRAQQSRRFLQAGFYSPFAASAFVCFRVLLAGAGMALGLATGVTGTLSPSRALFAGVCLAGVGLLLPGLWLEARTRRWQGALRRGLPDAMDLMVLCLEGGVSLSAALQYVTTELRLAHPELSGELEILQHEMLLGKTAGEAMQKFGARSGLEEVRTLATVLLQNERFGVSVAKALRIHAETMRLQRQQRAEEMAQKAAVKILFPTLLCIFPAIFIVILGPAAFRIASVFAQMK